MTIRSFDRDLATPFYYVARSHVEPLTPVRSLQRNNMKVGQRVGEATDRGGSMLVPEMTQPNRPGHRLGFHRYGAFYVSIGWLCDTNEQQDQSRESGGYPSCDSCTDGNFDQAMS
ncbi:MAG: hypothetical protein E5W98_03620 [Mesorhizobium sp.]|nr:MAG: hypothetical protein E5W98_03620 [Mesorhizobium sp.]